MALAATSAKEDASDSAWLVEQLAGVLCRALPKVIKPIESRSLFRKVTIGFEAHVGDFSYRLVAGSSPEATRCHTVRGIALKTESLPTDEWLEEFGAALEVYAERHEDGRNALREALKL